MDKLKWNLNHIVNLKDFEALYENIDKNLEKYDAYFIRMHPDMHIRDFVEYMDFSEEMKEKLSRLGYRAYLMEAENQKSSKARLLKSRVKDISLKINDRSRKISHWLKGMKIENKPVLDKDNAKRLFNAVKDLEYVLSYNREFAMHTLNESEESIVVNKDANGIDVLNDLRVLLETEFEYDFKPKGYKKSKKIKNQAELVSNVHSSDKNKREAAYRALLGKYKENLDKFFLIYQAVVKDWGYETRVRKYDAPISIRNKYNHVPDSAVNILLDVCVENRDIFWRYFRYKSRELKMKKLERFDIYAPVKEEKRNMPLADAVNIVKKSLESFCPGFYKGADLIIKSGHVDSHPDQAKVGGAFCATVSPNIHPYILLNYTGSYRDVMTLAHELGHGIHSVYASCHSMSSQVANLPLSETASTLSEMVVFERLLEDTKNTAHRKALLVNRLADSYATILRQNYFVKFEIQAHNEISNGLTAEKLSDMYFKSLKEQFGQSVDIDPLFRYEWAYIPHIVHSPFYCYAYNFGELLSLSLYSRYKQEGKIFIKKIEKILEYGGSKNPQEILREAGVDINSGDFWQGSFAIIKNWMQELERL